MTVNELKNIEGFIEVSISDGNREITDIYTGDLLSWVMGHVRKEGTILFTVLNTINLIAVATLLDFSSICFCEGVIPTEDIIQKAKEEGINLFRSDDTTFHSAMKIENL